MSQAALPRVTYSNIGVDFTPVHDHLDRAIPAWEAAALGRDHANRIAGADDGDGAAYEARSPIDRGLVLGRFVEASPAAVDRAFRAAGAAYPGWSGLPWRERVAAMRRFADALERIKVDMAIACLVEVGKSRLEALGEAEEAVDLVRYYCDEMERNHGFVRPMQRAFPHEQTEDVLRPYGPFAVIAPFNFPVALSVGMLTGAVLTGNTAVYKPSPMAGLTGVLVMRAVEQAGLPPGVVNLLCGGAAVGEAMVAHPLLAGVVFTGSHRVGAAIHRSLAAGRYVRPVVVEMGGKNPAYVAASADLDTAAAGVARSAFGLQGQKCSACAKVYVHEAVMAPFLERLQRIAAGLAIGDPRRRDVFMGPVIDDGAGRRFDEAVAAARRDGRLLFGGERLSGGLYDGGVYLPPTAVAGLPSDHPINRDELFLPLLSVLPFSELEAAIADGNRVAYGLTAGCYAGDEAELQVFLDRAEAGVLYANRASGATTGAWPGIQSFCGWKGSGVSGKGGLGPHYLQQFLREQSRTVMRPAPGAAQ